MTVPREQPGGDPDSPDGQDNQDNQDHQDGQDGPDSPDSEVTYPARPRPTREPYRFEGQGKRDGRSQVGVGGAMRARDVSRPAITPRHEV